MLGEIMLSIYYGDNLDILKTFSDKKYNLIYIDTPYNTGKVQIRKEILIVTDMKIRFPIS